jgi:hypothetical protein
MITAPTNRYVRGTRTLLAALFLSSCSRDLGVAPEPGYIVPDRTVAPSTSGDLQPEMVFDIATRVDGSLLPQHSITITAVVRARLRAPHTVIRIDAPEMEAASRSTWDDGFRVTIGEKLRAASTLSLNMSEGNSQTQIATLRAERAGLYRVVISASSQEALVRNAHIQNATTREVWLLITETGGRVLSDFDASVIPAGMVAQPGPFRSRSARAVRTATSPLTASQGTRALNSMSYDGFDHYRVVYWDADSAAYAGLPGVTASYDIYTDDAYGNSTITDYGYSGSGNDGSLIIECDYMGNDQRYVGGLRLTNGLVTISNADQFWGVSGSGGVNCGTFPDENPYQIIAPAADKARIFAVLTNGINESRAIFGKSRGNIAVTVSSSTGTSAYSGGSDGITIYSNAVWGSFGRFVALHEYGHALHEKALGGNAASGNCPSPHYFDGATNLQCAFSEGFADFHAQALGAGYFYYGGDYTYGCTNFSSNGSCTAYATSRDGSIVEGAVAIFLSHVTDPANPPHDNVSYPGAYVADVITNCRLINVYPVRINGADFMSYCLQDAMTGRTNFPSRNSANTVVYSNPSSKPANWSSASVNQLWVWDLFRL